MNCVFTDAARYRYLRERDCDTIYKGGIFAGQTPQNYVLSGEDLDKEIDGAMELEARGEFQSWLGGEPPQCKKVEILWPNGIKRVYEINHIHWPVLRADGCIQWRKI